MARSAKELVLSIFGFAIFAIVSLSTPGSVNSEMVAKSQVSSGSISELSQMMEVLEPEGDFTATAIPDGFELVSLEQPVQISRENQTNKVPEPSMLFLPVFFFLCWAFIRTERRTTSSFSSD